MDFTFVTCTYNHSKYILMHLESIKYQLKTCFRGDKITLIIADDGSQDDTLPLCRSWCAQNDDLFYKTVLLGDGKNRGTCRNLLHALEYVKDEFFYMLAGDDVYGFKNLKKAVCELEHFDLVSGVCPAFYVSDDGKYEIALDYQIYKTVIAKGTSPAFLRRLFTIEGCITEAAPAIYKSSMLDDSVKSQIRKCRLIEDQPMMYAFFKNKKLKMKYLDFSYVMYRVHPESVSHTQNSVIKKMAQKDLETLCDIYQSAEKNPVYQYVVSVRRQTVRGRRWIRFLFPSYLYLFIRQNLCSRKAKNIFYHSVIKDASRSVQYLTYLDKKARLFREKSDEQ